MAKYKFTTDSMIEESTKYFTCSCFADGHTIKVWLDKDLDTANFVIYQHKERFLDRLRTAFNYIFQVGRIADISQEVMLSQAQTSELIKFISEVAKEDEDFLLHP